MQSKNHDIAIKILRGIIEDENLECSDNYRVSCLDDEEGMMEFEESAENGCCGSFEKKLTINDEPWIIGCNYGH